MFWKESDGMTMEQIVVEQLLWESLERVGGLAILPKLVATTHPLSFVCLSFSHFHTFLHFLLGQLFKPLTPFRVGNLTKVGRNNTSLDPLSLTLSSASLSLSFSRPLTPFITFEHFNPLEPDFVNQFQTEAAKSLFWEINIDTETFCTKYILFW